MGYRQKRRLVFIGLALALGTSSVWGLSAAADVDLLSGDAAQVAYTDGDGINLRAAPTLDAGVSTTLPEGFAIAIEDGPVQAEDGSWWYAIGADTDEGYVSGWALADYLVARGAVDAGYADDGESISYDVAPDDSDSAASGVPIVNASGGDLNLRAEPSLAGEVLTSIPDGAEVEVLDTAVWDTDGIAWSQVRYDGSLGYAATDYLVNAISYSDAGTDDTGWAIAEAALAYEGTPYVWGGTTPDGFDCSGFTWYILDQELGIGLARPDYEQVESGEWVAAEDLQPGDLIFFQNTYQWGLSHVGIYLGSGQFVSATGEFDAVGVSNLNDPYWSARYLTARRIR